MGKLTNNSTINIDGLDLPINTHRGKYYCYVEPLEKIKRELDAMLSLHHKVYFLRFDVRVHTYTDCNKVITDFLKSYNERIKRAYKLKNIGSAWCREVDTAKKQHYHLIIMVNGSVTRTAGRMLEIAQDVASIQDLSIGLCENPSYLIQRSDLAKGDYRKYNAAFERGSYLAKERTKKKKGERVNSFQTSRLKSRFNEYGEIFKAGHDYGKIWVPC